VSFGSQSWAVVVRDVRGARVILQAGLDNRVGAYRKSEALNSPFVSRVTLAD